MKELKKIATLILAVMLVACSALCVSCKQVEADENVTIAMPDSCDFLENANLIAIGMASTLTKDDVLGDDEYLLGSGKQYTLDTQEKFNKFYIYYLSDIPVKATVNYVDDKNNDVTDIVYLESGIHKFGCLIQNYRKCILAKALTSVSFVPCKDDGHFLVWNISAEKTVIDFVDTIFITNGRYKLGVYMEQGGGLNYLSDSDSSSLKGMNLLNQHDEGRLVQQSYYGTRDNEEYTAGDYNNTHWRYNPVQGGDKYHNKSRIIDYVKNEHSIYVKCQPLDWSSNNFCTPSYMESTYTVYPDRVAVDCRFTDYSGWEHPATTHEFPAFYTIAYLDAFTYYAGESSWTNDELTTVRDLPFWGEPIHAQTCALDVKDIDENWCAWTNEADDYGIGLYTPIGDTLWGGRCGDSHSKDDKDGGCSYIAPLAVMPIVSYEPMEYSYLISTGSLKEIRETFYEYKDFDNN